MKSFQFNMHLSAKFAVVMLVFSSSISRGLFNTALFLTLLFSVASPLVRQRFIEAFRYTITKLSFAFFLLILIGGFYSPASSDHIFRQYRTYALFLLIPIFIAVLDDYKWQLRALLAFATSMIIILILSYADVLIEIPGSSTKGLGLGVDHSIFSDYIVQSIITVFFIVVCDHQAANTTSQRVKIVWHVLAALAALSVLLLLASRTGFILLVCILMLICFQRFSGKQLALVGVGILITCGLFLLLSPLAYNRLALAIFELKNITDISNQTSFGLRFGTWLAAWDMFMQQPWFGRGTGSYAYLAASYFKDCTWLCIHPHNQYLFFMVENGILGLALYCCILFSFIALALKAERNTRYMAVCFAALLVVNSMINAPFWFHREAYFFYTMTALLVTLLLSRRQF